MFKVQNHRMLITHSLIPPLIMFFVGICINWTVLWVAGISYLIHVLVDTIDWGTNLLGFHKMPVGLKILITNEEIKNLPEILKNYDPWYKFFDDRYYSNRNLLSIEAILLLFMLMASIFLALKYLIYVLGYFVFLAYHVIGRIRCLK